MSAQTIPLAGGIRVATEQIALGGQAIAHVQHVIASELGSVPRLRPQYLATSQGSIEMAVNGAAAAVAFDLAPGSAAIWRVARLVLQIVAPAAAAPDQFGSLAALASGLLVEVRNATPTPIIDLTAGQPIRANRDFGLGWATSIVGSIVTAEWRFAVPLRLEGGFGELLRLTVRDNLSGLTRMRVLAEVLEETVLT